MSQWIKVNGDWKQVRSTYIKYPIVDIKKCPTSNNLHIIQNQILYCNTHTRPHMIIAIIKDQSISYLDNINFPTSRFAIAICHLIVHCFSKLSFSVIVSSLSKDLYTQNNNYMCCLGNYSIDGFIPLGSLNVIAIW